MIPTQGGRDRLITMGALSFSEEKRRVGRERGGEGGETGRKSRRS